MSANKRVVSLADLSTKPWEVVGDVSQDAAVFVDDGAAELLHWAGGVALLEGCVGVYDLHSDLNTVARDFIAAAPYCHVVIVVSAFLHGTISKRIAKLLSDLQPLECHIFCSQTEEMHAQLIPVSEGVGPGTGPDHSTEGYSHYGEFQALMRKWINREVGVRVAVQHLPLFQAAVCQGLMTTPPYSAFFPLLPSDTVEIQSRLLSEGVTDCVLENLSQVDFDMLTRQYQTQIKCFANGVHHMMTEWDMAEEIFSLGPTARFIANQLANSPAARLRRKTASRRCSILLIDRTLDATNPSLHSTDSLVDRILALLPHPSPYSTDVSVDVSLLCPPGSTQSDGWALNGSLAQSNHPKTKQLLRTLICSKQKESLMEVSRCLLDCLSQEGLSIKLSGKLAKPSALQLKTFIQQFQAHPQACVSQAAVLQLACAVVQAMEGDTSKHWERLAAMEKLLLMSVQDKGSPSIAVQLAGELRNQTLDESAMPFTLAELLGVGVAMFSLVGVTKCIKAAEEEVELNEAFASLATKRRSCDLPFLAMLGVGEFDSHSAVVSQFEAVFQVLEGLGTARDHLTQFRHLFCPTDPSLSLYRPLLCQVTEAILDSGHPELPDLFYHPQASVSNIIKSSFSLFVSSARPHPNQHPILLLFVVGGVSCAEVRQIRDIVASSRTNTELIIGATKLVTSHDLVTQIASHCTHNIAPTQKKRKNS